MRSVETYAYEGLGARAAKAQTIEELIEKALDYDERLTQVEAVRLAHFLLKRAQELILHLASAAGGELDRDGWVTTDNIIAGIYRAIPKEERLQ